MGSLKRRMANNRDKKMGCSHAAAEESPSTCLIIKSDGTTSFPECCCEVPYLLLLKQLGWRVRSRWRQFLIRRRRCIRLNYDLRSYALNFDDARRTLHDRRSPLAP